MYWISNVLFLYYLFEKGNTASLADSCSLETKDKFECFPDRNGTNQEACESRGCCWLPGPTLNNEDKIPYCFFPKNYPSYIVDNSTKTHSGFDIYLKRTSKDVIFPKPVDVLHLEVIFRENHSLRIRITDPVNQRYEPLYPSITSPSGTTVTPIYTFKLANTGIGFSIIRNSDNTVIFDTTNLPLIYTDQFIQISSRLSSPYIYGLGERQQSFLLSTQYNTITMFAHDASPSDGVNIYGSHPFYLAMEPSGNSHGVFLLNTNALEIVLQPTPAITYRTIGGILDFFYFLGPTPKEVLQQYHAIFEPSEEVPFWAFGFQLCRWGVKTLNETKKILKRNLDAGIPVEVQWNDLDYMDERRDFIIDRTNFSDLSQFVEELHSKNMHYIPIIDPAIQLNTSYSPYLTGKKLDIFIKDSNGEDLIGEVWPNGNTVYPDFTHPNALDYWFEMLQNFHTEVGFDGVWIDMNEPSSFISGSTKGCNTDSSLDHPPYVPHVSTELLYDKTICMSAKQSAGDHYNLHNLYGYTESRATNLALKKIIPQRTVIISRSTFAGSQVWAQHWTGDVFSKWNDLKQSITQIMNFGLFLIPYVGADICGFVDNTTESLCNRWLQLGAFYPFSRSHNTETANDQDPAVFSQLTINSTKKALNIRYSLLSYIYTTYMSVDGYQPIFRPLLYEFPEDFKTYEIDTQFLLGPALMVVPVLYENHITVDAYLPKGIWYDYYTKKVVNGSPGKVTLSAPLDTIPLLIRGGYILTMQQPEMTTNATRANDVEFLVAPDESFSAKGELFWDDGVTRNTKEKNLYTLSKFNFGDDKLSIIPTILGEKISPKLKKVTILNVDPPKGVLANGQNHEFLYDINTRILTLNNLNLNLNEENLLDLSRN